MSNKKQHKIALFEGKQNRRHWDDIKGLWYFSVVDIIFVLTESSNSTDYLKKLRKRDSELGNYIGTNCPQIEMVTKTGKNRKTLAGSPEHLFRIIQSIPSPKAEPIKIWLARVGYERIHPVRYEIIKRGKEIEDPELIINRVKTLIKLEKYVLHLCFTKFKRQPILCELY